MIFCDLINVDIFFREFIINGIVSIERVGISGSKEIKVLMIFFGVWKLRRFVGLG